MFCTVCGKNNGDACNGKFCTKCGSKFKQEDEADGLQSSSVSVLLTKKRPDYFARAPTAIC